MLQTFTATLSPMLVLFCCMIIGFIAKKKNLTPDNTATVLSKLENYFLVPALIINTFMRYCTIESIGENYTIILYSTFILAVALGIAFPLSKAFSKKGSYQRSIYRYALTFGNFSFMGCAIVPAILGDEALYYYMLYIMPLNIAVYTWGVIVLIPQGEAKQSIFKSLLNPIVVSIVIGAVLGLLGVESKIPAFLKTAISNCAGCMGPLAMILTGFVIGGYDIKKLLTSRRIYVATLLRLFILPALFILILKVMGADKTTLVLTLFAYATPLGLNTVVFPAAYGGDTFTGASMAMISHTICIISIPLMFALLIAM